ncbi:MAG: signal recognition particle-docking protein FtsY [Cyanobacteria bacterium CRU_2_1]|nr:signal recognition particle-docking protein FtsY [Cyanobacteria bacterium CRU_2_1]
MAPFNWFNRKFSDTSESQTESPESEESAQTQPQIEATSPDRAETSAVAQNQLDWAKVAYENIRKRQQQEKPVAPVETPLTEAELTPTESTVEEFVEAPEEAEPTPLAEPVAAESTPATELEAIAELAEDHEPIAPSPIASSPSPPLSFWAQAEADRQARLERLKAEAIAAESEVVPLVSELPTLSEPPAIPGLILDEAFLWSAEVLAAQGRLPEGVSIEEITWLKRLRQGLDKTRRSLVNQLRAIVGQGPLNQAGVTEIESLLLQADVGIDATDYIIEALQARLRQEALPPSEAIAYLKQILRDMLDKPLGDSHSLSFVPEKDMLNIWLITGVNGAGKTTTIGKIAHIAQKSGYRCLIAAADTFRAAAVQQVKVWGERSNVEVIANPGKNTDPAAVVFDAIIAAQARHAELLLVDTAGRLQNKKNLMDELSKIRRIIDKKAPGAIVESLLVLDSTLGQNGLRQAEVFSEVAKLSGVVLTKLDGTAKGGIALAVVQQLGLPIRFIGAGEGIEDLRPFSSYEFVEALLSG